MCVGGSSSPSFYTPRDTSNDPVVSKYDLPPELVEREKMKARNRAKSLVAFNKGGDRDPFGGGMSTGSGFGGYNDASGGFRV